jgi:hypothetical protein
LKKLLKEMKLWIYTFEFLFFSISIFLLQIFPMTSVFLIVFNWQFWYPSFENQLEKLIVIVFVKIVTF